MLSLCVFVYLFIYLCTLRSNFELIDRFILSLVWTSISGHSSVVYSVIGNINIVVCMNLWGGNNTSDALSRTLKLCILKIFEKYTHFSRIFVFRI
jgi:hypothetical protein